jgi:hypothetical protein
LLDGYPSNLPSALTTFVGRENDVRQLLGDLDRADVVTLTGTGGVGKTRLAVQTCAEALPRFPSGVWFVDLATVRDGDQIASTVAMVLGVKARPGEALAITLRDWLRERRAIVLLDNAEHVVDAVSHLLVDLRQRGIAARFVVTSLEPLGIDGEQVRRVPSLDTAEAVELFVLRVRGRNNGGSAGRLRRASRARRQHPGDVGAAGDPMGSFLLVWFEGDVEKAFADLATNDSEFMTWFRGQVLVLTGVDLSAPPEGPPPAVLVDWHA